MGDHRPNIVLLFTDQEAYYRHGWDGGLAPRRPNLERLGREGIRFERAYSVCPLCTPARRSLMTGLYPHAHGFLTLDDRENTQEHDCGLLYELLAEQGYRLYNYGKWHAGPGTAHDHGCAGFSYPEFGNPYVTPEYRAYCERRGLEPARFTLEHVFIEAVSPDRPSPGPGYRCEADSLHPHVTGVLETPPDTHESFFLANLACEALRGLAAAGDGRPFFLRVDTWGPHAPYLASEEYVDMYPLDQIVEYGSFRDDLEDKPDVYRKEWNQPLAHNNQLVVPNALPWSEWRRIMRYVYAHVTQVDAACGKVLDALDDLGLAEDTLVIWTSDHGDAISSYGGHLGKEAPLSEEVLRVPMAMRWPGRVAPGQLSQHLVSTVDVPATVLEAAGTAFHGPVHGQSLVGPLEDGRLANREWRDQVVCETHGHHWEPVRGRTLITDRYRYAVYQYHGLPDYLDQVDILRAQEELYDLEADPYQLHNLASRPEGQEALVNARRRLRAWQWETGDPVWFSFT